MDKNSLVDQSSRIVMQIPREVGRMRACLMVATIGSLLTGCIPSPNRPLGEGDGRQQSDVTSAVGDLANRNAPSSPAIQPLVTEQVSLRPDDSVDAENESGDVSLPPNEATGGLSTLLPLQEPGGEVPPTQSSNDGPSRSQLPESNTNTNGDLLVETVTPIRMQGTGDLLDDGPIPNPPPGTRPTIENPIDNIQVGSPDPEPTALPAGPSGASPDTVVMDAPLIPRATFFGNPQRTLAKISPDGESLAFLGNVDGVMNVFVAPSDRVSDSRPATDQRAYGIEDFFWAYTSRHILFLQDSDGDKNYHLYCSNLDTGEVMDLTPLENVSVKVTAISHKHPTEILVSVNDRPPHDSHDIHRVNIVTGDHELLLENPGFREFVIDDDYKVRFACEFNEFGGKAYFQPGEVSGWDKYMEFAPDDAMTSSFLGFDQTGDILFFVDSRQNDTAVLKALDLTTGESEVLAENPLADAAGTLVHPVEKNVQAVTFDHARRRWKILDSRIDEDLEYLSSIVDGEVNVISRTLDDSTWTVEFERDDGPNQYFLYSRDPRGSKLLFSERPELDDIPLVKMHALPIAASDGLDLVSYLSLPPGSDLDSDGRPAQPVPLVLLVHGGPWDRDTWGYNPVHQMLANRGYGVLSVNFRGSTGFGKKFMNAGNRQWGRQIHGDLIDAVQFAIQERIADPDCVAIMGGSFGGYATLCGLAFTPDVFACGIDIVGPPNLIALMENPPADWIPFFPLIADRVGDPQTTEGRADLLARSPISRVSEITRPLLIGHGARDPLVRQEDADRIVASLQHREIPVTYLLYPDEGHGFQQPRNRLAFYAATEAFLAKYLGGRAEPLGDALKQSSVEIPVEGGELSGASNLLITP